MATKRHWHIYLTYMPWHKMAWKHSHGSQSCVIHDCVMNVNVIAISSENNLGRFSNACLTVRLHSTSLRFTSLYLPSAKQEHTIHLSIYSPICVSLTLKVVLDCWCHLSLLLLGSLLLDCCHLHSHRHYVIVIAISVLFFCFARVFVTSTSPCQCIRIFLSSTIAIDTHKRALHLGKRKNSRYITAKNVMDVSRNVVTCR